MVGRGARCVGVLEVRDRHVGAWCARVEKVYRILVLECDQDTRLKPIAIHPAQRSAGLCLGFVFSQISRETRASLDSDESGLSYEVLCDLEFELRGAV